MTNKEQIHKLTAYIKTVEQRAFCIMHAFVSWVSVSSVYVSFL